MARRDVELVIRAKDEAKRAIDSVSDALRSLVQSQDNMSGSSTKVDTALTRLGAAVGNLNKQFSSLTGIDRATAAMQRAEAASNRLQHETQQTALDGERLARASVEIATRVQQLARSSDETATAIARQRAELEGTQTAQRAYAAEIKRAETENRKLEATLAKLPEQIKRQSQAVIEASTTYGRLENAIAGVDQVSQRMVTDYLRAGEAYETADAKLLDLVATQQRAEQSTRALTGDLTQLRARLAQSNTAATAQKIALDAMQAEYRELVSSTRAAAQEQDRLQSASAETATALARQSSEVAEAEQRLAAATAEMAKLTAQQQKFASAGVGVLIRALREQQGATVQTRNEWKALSAAAAELKRELVQSSAPTKEMADDYDRLRAASIQARAEFNAQGQALQQQRAALFEVRSGTIDLAAAQQRFASSQVGLNATLKTARQESGQTATQLLNMATAARAAATAQQQLQQATVGYGSAAGAAAGRTHTFAQAMRALYGESRTAMSFTQRLRSEVLSLIAAYGGIFGAVQGIRNVVEATLTLERAQNRLGVIFEGDLGLVNQEMSFLTRTADRLGINLGILAEQYTKFASSTLDTNLEGQKSRDIFIAISEAATVLGLSAEDVQGVFRALGQIASKGTVQMEELRGQLGDRFPAALQLMADGLGVTRAELEKMTKDGEVSADALDSFAQKVIERYRGELPAALERLPAIMGRLGNAAFNALRQVGEGGFIDAFLDLMKQLTEFLESDQAATFFSNLSSVMATATETVGFFIEHINLTVIALSAFIGMKLAPFIGSLIASLLNLGTGFVRAGQNAVQAGVMMRGFVGSAGAAAAAATTLRTELMLLTASTGIGLALTAIGAAVGYMVTRTDDATAAMNQHDKIVQDVENAYDRLKDSTGEWADLLEKTTLTQAQSNFTDLQDVVKDTQDEVVKFTRLAHGMFLTLEGTRFEQDALGLLVLFQQLEKGEIKIDEFRQQIDALAQSTGNEIIKGFIANFLDEDLLDRLDEGTEKLEVARAIIENWGDPEGIRVAINAALGLGGALEGAGNEATDTANKVAEITKEAQKLEQQWRALTDEAESLGGVVKRVGENADQWIETAEGVKMRRDLAEANIAAETLNETNSTLPDAFLEAVREAANLKEEIVATKDAGDDLATIAEPLNTSLQKARENFQQTAILATGEFEKIGTGIRGIKSIIETEMTGLADPVVQTFGEATTAVQQTVTTIGESTEGVREKATTDLEGLGTVLSAPFEQALGTITTTRDQIGQVALAIEDALGGFASLAVDIALAFQTTNTEITRLPSTAQVAMDALIPAIEAGLTTIQTGIAKFAASVREQFASVRTSGTQSFRELSASVVAVMRKMVDSVKAMIASLKAEMASLKASIDAAQRAANAAKDSAPGKAGGGPIFGAGSGTSDSILARLSNGEYVIRAAAVRKYGMGIMHMLNNMLLPPNMVPGFATGGPVSIPVEALPFFADGGLDRMASTSSKPTRVVNLSIAGQRFEGLIAPEQTAQSMMRFARKRQVRSAGRSPNWRGGGG